METRSRSSRAQIRAVIVKEGDWYVAQCLEHDITAQAKSLTDLYHEVQRVLATHVAIALSKDEEPFADIPAAPKRYWDMFEAGEIDITGRQAPFWLHDNKSMPLPMPWFKMADRAVA